MQPLENRAESFVEQNKKSETKQATTPVSGLVKKRLNFSICHASEVRVRFN